MNKTITVIGLMSGTSADGINATIVKISGSGLSKKINLIHHNRYPYSRELRHLILDVSAPGHGTTELICHLNFVLGQKFADAALRIAKEADITTKKIDLIGSHGQTVCHIPRKIKGPKGQNALHGYRVPSTLQIGDPSLIAEATGITTVADFRPRDIAAGGEGAPLSPYAHRVLFNFKKPVVINNLGGISNVTYLPVKASVDQIIAFDTGPGNMVIDAMSCLLSDYKRGYDLNGSMARRGKVNKSFLEKMMRHLFLHKPPPKSTGREDFGFDYTRTILNQGRIKYMSPVDLMATVTAFTARSIALSYEKFIFNKHPVEEAIFYGGGVKNRTLMAMIKKELKPITVKTSDDHGIPPDAVESISFAILAHAAVLGEKTNVPSATGAKSEVTLGKIVPGENWCGLS